MKKISLYIHIPFCKQKCLYCDFQSFCGKDNLKETYIDALIKEIESLKGDYIINTIFIGGGTPSYLEVNEMKKLFNSIGELALSKEIEYTMECNPGTLSREKLEVMKAGGVNRISFGLQSADNGLLKKIGRIHNYEEFVQNFELAREVGFNNINVDLMYGLPTQKSDQWQETLNTICALKPEHISAYSLIVEEGTAFYTMFEKDLLILPDENEERVMDKITKDTLKSFGYTQYEISNYALQNKECKHNKVYWQLGDYVGVGSSSSSYVDGFRYTNTGDIEEYIERIQRGKDPYEEKIKNKKSDDIEEFIFMGLRLTKGISVKEFKERFNLDIFEMYGEVLKKNISNGMIIKNEDRLLLSERGLEMSNEVMAQFILDK